jgi:hypothetical protein
MQTDRSRGRYPDGAAAMETMNPATPAASNRVTRPAQGMIVY